VASAVKAPQRFRAVAPLGGGGTARGTGLASLPFLVGVGTRDFALQGARGLHERLTALGAPSTLREYPDVEHLAIVQVALPDVFAFFERSLEAQPPGK
jgi:acetyl esterase/lipase